MSGTAIGVDLGGTKIEGVVLDGRDRQLARKRVATEATRGYEHVVDAVARLVDELRVHAPGCARVGIGTPGAISARTGLLKNSNTQCLNGRTLREDIEARIGIAVRMENDANCFALAEALAGSGRGHELVFGVILGTGVGGGIVWRGEIWSGPQHIAGEWGHHSIDPAGPSCYCGQRGCVETLLSGSGLQAAYRAACADAPRSATSTSPGRADLDAREIALLAERGDAVAAQVLAGYLDRFGRALANLISILDPSVVVLGGGLSNLEVLYTRGREAVAAAIFNDELTTPIVPNTLGDSAGVIGAALLAR